MILLVGKVVRIAVRLVALAVIVALVYLAVIFAVVWHASGVDSRRHGDAIVVLGAAQYDGRPSPVLQARLDHAYELWKQHVAPLIVVTSGKQAGDRFTEAAAGARYLHGRGVPDSAILREVQGTSSWESLQAAARFLSQSGRTHVTLVSDSYHAARIADIAEELGLDAVTSSTHLLDGSAQWAKLAQETVRVAAGRVFGYDVLARHDRVENLVPGLATIGVPG